MGKEQRRLCYGPGVFFLGCFGLFAFCFVYFLKHVLLVFGCFGFLFGRFALVFCFCSWFVVDVLLVFGWFFPLLWLLDL